MDAQYELDTIGKTKSIQEAFIVFNGILLAAMLVVVVLLMLSIITGWKADVFGSAITVVALIAMFAFGFVFFLAGFVYGIVRHETVEKETRDLWHGRYDRYEQAKKRYKSLIEDYPELEELAEQLDKEDPWWVYDPTEKGRARKWWERI